MQTRTQGLSMGAAASAAWPDLAPAAAVRKAKTIWNKRPRASFTIGPMDQPDFAP